VSQARLVGRAMDREYPINYFKVCYPISSRRVLIRVRAVVRRLTL